VNTIFRVSQEPYANQLKRQITIRLDSSAWSTSRKWRPSWGCLIRTSSIVLRDCAMHKRRRHSMAKEAPKRQSAAERLRVWLKYSSRRFYRAVGEGSERVTVRSKMRGHFVTG